jgi:putative RecB family exonuclease
MRTVSASRLQCWQQCRLKFFFRYVLALTKPITPPLHVGKTVHAVLQAWSLARWRKEPFRIETFRQLFENDWKERQADTVIHWDNGEEKQRTSAWAVLENYFLETPIKADERPEAVEVVMEVDLAAHGLPRLVGIIDLVRAGGRIVDFKTASKTSDAAQVEHLHETQLSCYSVLYRDATGRKETGLELHHLVKTKQPKLIVTAVAPMKDKQETRLFRGMESYVEGLERQDFVPSPGMGCLSCEYFNECRGWGGNHG